MIGVRKSEGAKRMRKNLERYFAERREKKKTGNIRVTYEELLEQAAGNEERKLLEIRTGRVREFQQLLEAFVQEGVLSPVKRRNQDIWRRSMNGMRLSAIKKKWWKIRNILLFCIHMWARRCLNFIRETGERLSRIGKRLIYSITTIAG